MKKIRIVSSIVILVSASAFCNGHIHFSSGINLSFTSDQDPDSVSAVSEIKRGVNVGLFFEQTFVERFSLITGLSFESRGETESKVIPWQRGPDEVATDNIDTEVRMLYLNIPILAQYNQPAGKIVRLNVFAGPMPGIQLNAKAYSDIRTTIVDTVQHTTTKEETRDTTDFSSYSTMMDFGILAGIGAEITVGPGAFFIRSAYYRGLCEFTNKGLPKEDIFAPRGGKHRNISIRLGYKFTFSSD